MFVYMLLTLTVVSVQLLFLNICFVSILLCYFYEILCCLPYDSAIEVWAGSLTLPFTL